MNHLNPGDSHRGRFHPGYPRFSSLRRSWIHPVLSFRRGAAKTDFIRRDTRAQNRKTGDYDDSPHYHYIYLSEILFKCKSRGSE